MNALLQNTYDDPDTHTYKVAFGEGLQRAFLHKEQFLDIVLLARQFSDKLRELQEVDETWEYVLTAVDNFDLDVGDKTYQWGRVLGQYAKRHAEPSQC